MNKMAGVVLLCSVVAGGCSRAYNEDEVARKFSDDPLYTSVTLFEQKENLSEDEYEEYALQCMLFAESAGMLDATLMMMERTQKVHKKCPHNALLLSYYATVVGIAARDDKNTTNRIRYADDSNDLMDKAVEMEPENPVIRLTRAHTAFEMPDFFERADIAREDYDFVIEWHRDGGDILPDNEIALVYYNRAGLMRREGKIEDAIQYYETAAATVPDTEIAQKASDAADALR